MNTLPIFICILDLIQILVGDAFLKVEQKVLNNFRNDVIFLWPIIIHVRVHAQVNCINKYITNTLTNFSVVISSNTNVQQQY